MSTVAVALLVWWVVGATLTFVACVREDSGVAGALIISLTWPLSLLVGMFRGLK